MSKLYIIFSLSLFLIFSCNSDDAVNPETEQYDEAPQLNMHGEQLFQAKCAACHHPLKDLTGPALRGTLTRTPGKEWVYRFVQDPAGTIASGDKYANELSEKWHRTPMTAFPDLSHADIDSILDYCDHFQ